MLSWARALGGLFLPIGSRGQSDRGLSRRSPNKGASQMRRVHGGIGRARFRITALVYCEDPWKHLGASSRMGRDRVPILLCSHDRPALGGLARDQEKVTKGESEGYRAGRSAAQRGNREGAS